ncbi:Crp/Fnr family transcriptional regulator [Pedobacter metabolipauper]|uniref:CRP-like cAMP-binding protein n=1 Tax=Pedobacter metabolipauper TaxID=425513 RepID=A0A4R6SXV1_9SPHI|nr:Crp/Fnr family transcriptional regulator [Pedobacter metabolipauper]TDQ10279.1 CRP-like cAMP-binding protein [Pedobacter metabolipauper]
MLNEQILYDFLFACKSIPEELKDENEREKLISYFNTQVCIAEYSNNTVLLQADYVPDHVYYVHKGMVKGYTIDRKNKEKVAFLWLKNSLVADAESFISRSRTNLNLQVTAPGTILISITYRKLISLFEHFPYTRIFLDGLEENNCKHCNIDLLEKCVTGRERLEEMRCMFPKFEQHVPKKLTADFLHITRQRLTQLYSDYR